MMASSATLSRDPVAVGRRDVFEAPATAHGGDGGIGQA